MKQRKKKGQKDIAPPVPSVTTQTQKTIELMTATLPGFSGSATMFCRPAGGIKSIPEA
jgi:hypothetical protein